MPRLQDPQEALIRKMAENGRMPVTTILLEEIDVLRAENAYLRSGKAVLDQYEATAVAEALGVVMSEISEECYCAGWLSGLEYILWRFVVNGPGSFGQGEVDAAAVARLKHLSEVCGGWMVWDEVAWRRFVPMSEWLVMFGEHEARRALSPSLGA